MIESCDAGSLPFVGDLQKFLNGARSYGQMVNDATQFFENKVVDGFLDKAEAGIDVPTYPQYRDMIQMFFDMIEGVGKIEGSLIETGPLSLRERMGLIQEASAIKNRSKEIFEKLQSPFQLRICVTGPYTLSSLLTYKDRGTFPRLSKVLAEIIAANVFSTKHGSVKLVSVDEPVFGFVDDPLLDRGSEGRENLLRSWESMMQKIRGLGAHACLHLHNASSDELFWDVKNLDVIESHVNDPFYQAKRTKERLEETDKFLKASITVTDFDELIRSHIAAKSKQKLNEITLNEKIAETWQQLKKKQVDPLRFVESCETMKERLNKVVRFFGGSRVLYAGPECGLRGYPTYETALECLRRVSAAVGLQAV